MYNKQTIGKLGENITYQYLNSNDYQILDRNFSCRQGEIDIIGYDTKSKEIVFVEVKTRTSFEYGFPSEAVNRAKQKHMLDSAKYYLYCNKLEESFARFDVIEVVIDTKNVRYKLNHLKGII